METSDFIGACAKGGAALDKAVTRLTQAQWQPLMSEAVRTLRNEDHAHDVVQQTLFSAWHRCRDFRGDCAVTTWLRSILRNRVIDHWRATRPDLPLLDEQGEVRAEVEGALQAAARTQTDPERLAADAEMRRVYDTCFARLTADHPQAAWVIRWTAEDGLSIDEVAGMLGRTPAATREFVSQSRKKARLYLADWYALAAPRQSRMPA